MIKWYIPLGSPLYRGIYSSLVERLHSLVERQLVPCREAPLYNLSLVERLHYTLVPCREAPLSSLPHTDFRRIQQFIMTEQQVIRDDIERAANEIESLDTEIRGHISRNTACLDVGVVRKRRKRKSTRYNTFR